MKPIQRAMLEQPIFDEASTGFHCQEPIDIGIGIFPRLAEVRTITATPAKSIEERWVFGGIS
jgi:hypothetical protein